MEAKLTEPELSHFIAKTRNRHLNINNLLTEHFSPKHELNDLEMPVVSPIQKTQLFLDSKRLLDHTEFIDCFKSWEEPSTENK